MIQFFIGNEFRKKVNATGAIFVQEEYPGYNSDISEIQDNNVHAHIYVSWLHPFKEQRLVVIGDKSMMVFEDTLKENKLKFYRKGI